MIAGAVYTDIFTIKNGAMQPVLADAAPVVTVLRNSIVTSLTVTIVVGAVGEYTYSFDVPSNWVSTDDIHVRIEAYIEGWYRHSVRRIGFAGFERIDGKLEEIAANQELLMRPYGLFAGGSYKMPSTLGGAVQVDGEDVAEVTGDCNNGFTITGDT